MILMLQNSYIILLVIFNINIFVLFMRNSQKFSDVSYFIILILTILFLM